MSYKDAVTDTVQQVTYYSYDQIGNVKTLWQQMLGLEMKQIEYKYDLVSGKVNKVRYNYQDDRNDQFWYAYDYDADNRVIKSATGVNTVSSDGWDIENPRTDAGYRYYYHGPLARMELGHDQLVQGVDYAYTLQGWLKQVNSQFLSPAADMGGDGVANKVRSVVAPDLYGYSLDYYKGDYKPIAGALALGWTDGSTLEIGRNLYNGNISLSTMALSQFNNTVGYSYRYDQLNRLKSMRQHSLSSSTPSWSSSTAGDAYREDVTYDANGNILTYFRNGSGANGKGVGMDNLTYGYSKDANGYLLNNKLLQVNDAVTSSEYTEDLKNQGSNNYSYDSIGNLVKEVQAGITKVEWTVYGKIKSITLGDTSSLEYRYDAGGNRVYKGYTHNGVINKTWYVRDAQGNTLSVYGTKGGGDQVYWQEQDLYGSSRLGIWEPGMLVATDSSGSIWDQADRKRYELSNHLGNVLVTLGDYLEGDNKAVVYSAQDYYPFGMLQVDRRYSLNEYRYGFNGKENDNEVKGDGNEQDYGMRVYDPRLGKFLSVDPLTKEYLWYSPYHFAGTAQ